VAHDLPWVAHHAGFIPTIAMIAAVAVLLRLARRSIWQFALLSLPGTIAHEAAHLAVGLVLGANPSAVSFWPRRAGKDWQLGSVTFGNVTFWNGAFVTLAPLALLPLSYALFTDLLLPLWSQGAWGWWLLAGYATAAVFVAALPSAADLRLGARSIAFYAGLGLALAAAAWLLRDL